MRFRIICAMILVFMSIAAYSQFSTDPLHEIYRDIDLWEGTGYIRHLPPFRPYPLQEIKHILETVIANGSADAANAARNYLAELQADVNWAIKLEHQSQSNFSTYHWKVGPGTWLQGFIGKYVSYATDIMIYISESRNPFLPFGQRSIYDLTYDITSLGGTTKYFFQLKAEASIGRKNLYLQTGTMRRSFGPFSDDSVVYSSNARAAPGFVFYWRGKKGYMAYTSSLFIMEAVSIYRNRTEEDSWEPNGPLAASSYTPAEYVNGELVDSQLTDIVRINGARKPNKFMQLQMLSFYPLPWLEMGFFETIVWGPRFDAKYLLPFKILYHLQSMGDFPDNTLIGLYFDFRAGKNWKIPLLMYVDDISLIELLKFNPDAHFKMALQTGIRWTPNTKKLRSISLEYIIVTPYMYTHTNNPGRGLYSTEANYTNYTHFGKGIGSTLQPNSDRLTFRIRFMPIPQLEIDLLGSFSQHANASEGRLKGPANDGSLVDDGFYTHYDEDEELGEPSFWKNFPRFLGQSVVQRNFQTGMTIRGKFKLSRFMSLTTTIEYTFEYTMNKDLKAGNNVFGNYVNFVFVFSFYSPKKKPEQKSNIDIVDKNDT